MSDQLLNTDAKHPFSITALADRSRNTFTELAFKTGWAPITRLAESAVIALMQNVTKGHLRVLTPSHIYNFPSLMDQDNEAPELKSELRVVNDVFWVRLCTMGDLGFAEAYMYGDVECDDLVSVFQIFLMNRENLSNLNSRMSYLFALPQKLTSYRFLNTIGNSRSNMSAHYDISNEMFSGFLSEDMTYSSGIFADLDGDMQGDATSRSRSEWSGGQGLKRIGQPPIASTPAISADAPFPPTDELYDAQIRKLNHIITKLKVLPNQRILEIGSGWGSLAILLAQTIPGTTIDTLTLSSQQQFLAQARISAAGLSERITVHLMDYRAMPKAWESAFDRVVSVEMIEHVGREFLEAYWAMVDWAMKTKGGVGVVQVITIPEARLERYMQEIDFIRKWSHPVFPGGFLPTLTSLISTLSSGSSGRLVVDSVSNIGPHYARTLREWRRRFLARFESVIVPALSKQYPEVMGSGVKNGREEIEVFKRKWLYYYCYCEVGFTTRTLGDHIVTFTREGCEEYGTNIFE